MDFDSFVNDIQKNSWNVFRAEVYEEGILTHSFGDKRKVGPEMLCPP